jgi:hypothetical protein
MVHHPLHVLDGDVCSTLSRVALPMPHKLEGVFLHQPIALGRVEKHPGMLYPLVYCSIPQAGRH